MSTEKEPDKDPGAEASVEERSIAELTAGGDPASRGKAGRDLEAEALAAAEDAIFEGERAIRELKADVAAQTGRASPGTPRIGHRALRAMLIFNLILMAVMLVLPEAETPQSDTAGTDPVEVPPPDPPPPVADPRPGSSGGRQRVPDSDHWSRAFALLGEAKYEEAAETLLEYERLNPQMMDGQRLDLYTMVSSCLFKAGRMEEAARYRSKSRALVNRGYLPEDLRDAARKAWEEGRSQEARRYFARFLLQQKQLPPDLRESVAEAFLRIGDSYRMAADIGDTKKGYPIREVEPDSQKVQGEKR